MADWFLRHDSTEALKQRLKSWKDVEQFGGPAYLEEAAPKVIADLEREIAERQVEVRE